MLIPLYTISMSKGESLCILSGVAQQLHPYQNTLVWWAHLISCDREEVFQQCPSAKGYQPQNSHSHFPM